MVQRNKNIAKLPSGYLFPEINRRRKELLAREPGAKIISLGIGNTTEPLTPHIVEGLKNAALGLGTLAGYSGYGDEQGFSTLRERIAQKLYGDLIKPGDVFISDGAKCDIGRLQILFGGEVTIAVQDPSYPVYVDGGVIVGQSGPYGEARKQFEGVTYLACTPENNFMPDLSRAPRTDIIYFCSPNNPTGAVATHDYLTKLVQFAKKNRSIIIYDAAYAMYIQDASLPRTIFEIEGAREVALEVNSFSKIAGFTGLRLGWTVVPEELRFDDGHPVQKDWTRIVTTIFNGASNIVQHGGLAALDDTGIQEMQGLVSFYLENARIIREVLRELGFEVYGGDNAPYIWTRMKGQDSWQAFEDLLNRAHIVTTPGAGFGPAGEGFLRFSAFSHRENVIEAVSRLREVLR